MFIGSQGRGEGVGRLYSGWGDAEERGCLPFYLPQISGHSGRDVNGKCFFGSSHWKIPWTNGNSEKVVPFSRLGRYEWKFIYHLQVS